jgi:hypothetical protein
VIDPLLVAIVDLHALIVYNAPWPVRNIVSSSTAAASMTSNTHPALRIHAREKLQLDQIPPL